MKRGVATISMHNGKVNMMDRKLMPQFIQHVEDVTNNGAKGTVKNLHGCNMIIGKICDNKGKLYSLNSLSCLVEGGKYLGNIFQINQFKKLIYLHQL